MRIIVIVIGLFSSFFVSGQNGEVNIENSKSEEGSFWYQQTTRPSSQIELDSVEKFKEVNHAKGNFSGMENVTIKGAFFCNNEVSKETQGILMDSTFVEGGGKDEPFAPTGDFQGQIVNPFNDYEYPYHITAVSLTDSSIYSWSTDSLGYFKFTNFRYDIYSFFITQTINSGRKIDSIRIDSSNHFFKTTVPDCSFFNESGICSKCGNSTFVIKLDPYLIQDVWFQSKKAEKKYKNNQRKMGFSTYENKLVWVKGKKQNERMMDPCNHWFCTKHKEIF